VAVALVGCGSSSPSSSSSGQTSSDISSSLPKPLPYDAALFNELPASIRAKKTIVDASWDSPPDFIVKTNGTYTGVGATIAQYLQVLLGVKIKELPVDSPATTLTAILDNRAQIHIAPAIPDTLENQKPGYNFVQWENVGLAVLTRKADKVTNPLTFCGQTVARPTGPGGPASPDGLWFIRVDALCKAAHKPAAKPAFFPTDPSIVLGVQDGRAYAGILTSTEIGYFIKNDPTLFNPYIVPPSVELTTVNGMVVEKSAGSLTKALSTAMNMLYAHGILQAIVKEFGVPAGLQEVHPIAVDNYALNKAALGNAACCTAGG
jgi:ABC-type amino acid transport substrate-binding protein